MPKRRIAYVGSSDQQAFLKELHLDPLVSDFRTIPQLAEELWEVNEPYFQPAK